MSVIGLDLSLTSTGVATNRGTVALRPKKLRGYERLRWLRDGVLANVHEHQPSLVVVEGPSYGSTGNTFHQLAGWWWIATEAIVSAGYALAVAPPSSLKRFALGVGGGPKAGKDFMVAQAVRRFSWFDGGNDEADALWACAIGYERLGRPIVDVPKTHLTALEGVEWPEAA